MSKILLRELSIASSGAWTGRRCHVIHGRGSTVSQTKKVIMVVSPMIRLKSFSLSRFIVIVFYHILSVYLGKL